MIQLFLILNKLNMQRNLDLRAGALEVLLSRGGGAEICVTTASPPTPSSLLLQHISREIKRNNFKVQFPFYHKKS